MIGGWVKWPDVNAQCTKIVQEEYLYITEYDRTVKTMQKHGIAKVGYCKQRHFKCANIGKKLVFLRCISSNIQLRKKD